MVGSRRVPAPRREAWRGRGEAGVATLAVVLAIPAVVFLMSTVAQFVVYYHASHLVTAAAQETARAAQLADGTEAGARAHGYDFLAQAGPNLVLEPRVVVRRDTAAEMAQAEVHGRIPRLVPGMAAPTVSASAGGPLERFEPDTRRLAVSGHPGAGAGGR